MEKKIILVTGATGAIGGSVAKALLAGNKFAVRILTRNARTANALALQKAGADVVEASLDDSKALEKAMEGCYGVFGTTSFLANFEAAYQAGKNLADAVHKAGISHFIFHTLPGYNKLNNGKFVAPHYEAQLALQEYAKTLSIPVTFLHTGFYYEHFLNFFPLEKDDQGDFYFAFPQGETKLALTSVEDIGGVTATIFDHPAEYMGRKVGVVGADYSCAEYAAIVGKVLGKKVYYNYIPKVLYTALGFPGAAELAGMFEVQQLYIPYRQVAMIESYGLNPSMQRFEDWVKNNKQQFHQYINTQQELSVA